MKQLYDPDFDLKGERRNCAVCECASQSEVEESMLLESRHWRIKLNIILVHQQHIHSISIDVKCSAHSYQ